MSSLRSESQVSTDVTFLVYGIGTATTLLDSAVMGVGNARATDSAALKVLQIANDAWTAQAVYVAAELGTGTIIAIEGEVA